MENAKANLVNRNICENEEMKYHKNFHQVNPQKLEKGTSLGMAIANYSNVFNMRLSDICVHILIMRFMIIRSSLIMLRLWLSHPSTICPAAACDLRFARTCSHSSDYRLQYKLPFRTLLCFLCPYFHLCRGIVVTVGYTGCV